jgi:DNA-binding NarL/FixJ family response regulator
MDTPKRKRTIHVMVVDDHPLLRDGIISRLSRGHGITIIGEASNGADFFQKLPALPIDVLLLDLQMPEMNGPQTLMMLQKDYPKMKVLMLSMFNEKRMIREMFRLGACGYVTKDTSTEHLIDAIYNVHYKGYHTQDDTIRAIRDEVLKEKGDSNYIHTPFDNLRDRDLTVLAMICEGLTSEEIAPQLNVSKQTIDLCRTRLIAHFNARNVVHLVAEAVRLGIYMP